MRLLQYLPYKAGDSYSRSIASEAAASTASILFYQVSLIIRSMPIDIHRLNCFRVVIRSRMAIDPDMIVKAGPLERSTTMNMMIITAVPARTLAPAAMQAVPVLVIVHPLSQPRPLCRFPNQGILHQCQACQLRLTPHLMEQATMHMALQQLLSLVVHILPCQ